MGYITKPGIVRIDPTITNLLPGQFSNEEPIQSYPFGPSTMRVTNLAGGFPEETGDVIISRTSENTGHQIFVGAKTYFRTFDAGIWSLWRELGGATSGVTSVNNKTGDVTLTAADVGAETPEGAQAKANTAETNAKEHANQIVAAHLAQKTSGLKYVERDLSLEGDQLVVFEKEPKALFINGIVEESNKISIGRRTQDGETSEGVISNTGVWTKSIIYSVTFYDDIFNFTGVQITINGNNVILHWHKNGSGATGTARLTLVAIFH